MHDSESYSDGSDPESIDRQGLVDAVFADHLEDALDEFFACDRRDVKDAREKLEHRVAMLEAQREMALEVVAVPKEKGFDAD